MCTGSATGPFHAASTRAIADAAEVRQALIGYHFHGKEGLYVAVFEYITNQVRARLGPLAGSVEKAVDAPPKRLGQDDPRAHHMELLLRIIEHATALLVGDEATLWAQLILREQQQPTRAFSIVFDGFMGPMLALVTRLVRSICGGTEQGSRLTALSILGQMLVFRAARAGVLRHLGWGAIGKKELAVIQAHVRFVVTAQLAAPPLKPTRKKPRTAR
jgi:AcrR family transcriptional regulator